MKVRAVLFDLDHTLVPEFANYDRAFEATCAEAAVKYEFTTAELWRGVFGAATDLWTTSPVHAWCSSVGLDCPSSLLADFTGDGSELRHLSGWASEFRRAAWLSGLAAVGVGPDDVHTLGGALDEGFRKRVRDDFPPYDDVVPAMNQIASRYLVAIVTNGAPDLQRSKLRAAGLERYFATVVVSGDVGCGKPETKPFHTG